MSEPMILVVEDDPTLRLVAERTLRLLGYKCLAVGSGEEAMKQNDARIHLIFMDIGLPGIDGVHTTMLIREKELREGRARTPIIGLTAHLDKQKCLSVGMDDFLQKPAMMDDLKNMLDKWLPIRSF